MLSLSPSTPSLRVVIVDPNRPSQMGKPRRVDDADDDDAADSDASSV